MFNLFDPYVLPNFRILDKQAFTKGPLVHLIFVVAFC